MSRFPPMLNYVPLNEIYVDATPDGEFAIRLLTAYRNRCDYKWVMSGLSVGEEAVYRHMNEDQIKRGQELDVALEILKRERG